MRKLWIAAFALCFVACTREAALSPARFQDPDLSYAPFVRWWWPGNDVENEELKREVNLFADHHIGGVEIQSFALVVPAAPDRVVQKTYDYYFGPQTGLDAYYGKPFRAIFNDSYEFKTDRHITADFRETFRNLPTVRGKRFTRPLSPWMLPGRTSCWIWAGCIIRPKCL